MKNYIIFLLLLLFAMQISQINASETRMFSMGQVGLFTMDNTNVTPFPGTIMIYGNEVVTELRVKDFEPRFSAEVRIPVNSYMVGFNFNRPIFITPSIPGFNVGTGIVQLTNTSDLYFGTELMGGNVGVRVSLGRDGYNQDSTSVFDPQLDESARYMEFAAGFSSDNYDVGLSFELPSIKSETVMGGQTLKDEWSGTGINLIGRYFYELNEKMQAVPVATFRTSSTSQETDIAAGQPQLKTDYSSLYLNFGMGLQYQLNEDNLIIVAVDPFGYLKNEAEQTLNAVSTTITSTTTTFPRLYMGVEAKIKNGIVGRVGAFRDYQTQTIETKPAQGDATETSFQTSRYNVSFGLGIKVGKFLVDLDINDGMFFQGPNFISGQLRDLANQVSISYVFSEK